MPRIYGGGGGGGGSHVIATMTAKVTRSGKTLHVVCEGGQNRATRAR